MLGKGGSHALCRSNVFINLKDVAMRKELEQMEIVAIRNLFLKEMRDFLVAVDIETQEEVAARLARIKEIDMVLQEKKRKGSPVDFGLS